MSTANRAATEGPQWRELRVAATVGAVLLFWSVAASWLGRFPGFITTLLVVLVISSVHWRDRLTPPALANVAFYGTPLALLALWLS